MDSDDKPTILEQGTKMVLDQIADAKDQSADVEVTEEGVEASVSAEKWHTRITAFFQQKWRGGGKSAGVRASWKFGAKK